MSLMNWLYDRRRDLAYWKESRKFRHRMGEIDALEKQAEEARGRPLRIPEEPDLPGFPAEFNRDEVLPDLWVCAPRKNFGWAFDVQACLNRLGGWIRTYHDEETKESAAQSIQTAAYMHGVNPRLLVASLQREKGLIRTKKAPPQKDLDWAAGVGAYDSGPWDEKFKGFGTQIRSMAKTYRNRFDEWENGKTMKVNFGIHRLARPWNAATWSLLRYTPHDSSSLLTWKIMRFFFSK